MQARLFAVPTPRGLTKEEGMTLCLAADADKRAAYERRPELSSVQQSLAAQILLRYAAAETLRLPMRQVRIGYTDRGKPYLPGTGLCCSVSHTDGLCVCALADREIGVDAEHIRPHSARVAARVFSAEEQRILQSSADPDKTFFEIWTRRESFVKCLGTGLADIAAPLRPDLHMQTFPFREAFVISVCMLTESS